MSKNVLTPNPHPVGSTEARAWEDGYWKGRRDVVAQTEGASPNPDPVKESLGISAEISALPELDWRGRPVK